MFVLAGQNENFFRTAIFQNILYTFLNNTRLKLAKTQAKVKQQPEAKLLLSENNSLCSSMLSSKNNKSILKGLQKQVCLN